MLALGSFFASSCLKSGLPQANNSSQNKISGFNYEYRWLDTSVVNAGTPTADTIITVMVVQLGNSVNISNDTVYTQPILPSNLPASQVPYVTLTHIWAYANISDAAIIAPLGGAPTLGTAGDYSHPVSYQVMAANGSKRSWVIVTAPLK